MLQGECLLLVEGQERPLRQWDFVHCPPKVEHVFVGAGDGPCVILMFGARGQDIDIFYPRGDVAVKHGAAAPVETADPKESYADVGEVTPIANPWPELKSGGPSGGPSAGSGGG